MKVFVVGANGQIGKQLVTLLHNSTKHKVRAMVRKKEQLEAYQQEGIEAVLADLEGSVDDLIAAAYDSDAIVFTAGSGGHTGADKTLTVDLEGAARMIEAAHRLKVKQFIMVSAIYANQKDKWENHKLKHYLVAKHHADRILKESGVPYTIIRPGGLLNDEGTGKVTVSGELERSMIPRADVAATIFEVLEKENMMNKEFDLVSGDVTITEAVKGFT